MSVLRFTNADLVAYEKRLRRGQPRSAPQSAPEASAKADRWPLVLRDQIVAAGLPEPLREACFHPTRGWRSDLSWPDRRIAVEVEGQAHSIKRQRNADIEKHNAYMLSGWRYLRVTKRMVETGEALERARELLA